MKLQNLFTKAQDNFFYALLFGVFFIFLAVTVWGDDGLVHLLELKSLKKNLAAENEARLRHNLDLHFAIEALQKPGFIEQMARSKMGFVRPNETVYVVPDSN